VFGKKKKLSVDVSSLSDQLSDLSAQVAELAKANAQKAKPYASKLGSAAKDASGDILHRAEGAVSPTLEQVVAAAFSAVAPKMKAARDAAADKAAPYVSSAIDHASDAAHDLAPYVETARDRVKDDIVPRVSEAVAAGIAASAPYREEAARRGTAAVAALKGEVEVKPDHHWGRKILLATGLAGLVFAAYKYLTGESSTSGWQTPTSAPAPSAANTTTGAHATTPATDADDTSVPADAKPLGDAELAEDSSNATLPTDGDKS
jgi:hypothetical protein